MDNVKTVSYSQYSVYKQCPHRWYLDYVKELRKSESTIHTTFGTAVHEVLQEYLQVFYDKTVTEADKIHLPTLLKKKLIELYKETSVNGHYSTPEELTEFYEDGVAILEYFSKKRSLYFSKKGYELVGIEVPLQEPILEEIPRVEMKGFIDLIIKDKTTGEYLIYDIKTSTRGWSDYQKKDQTKVNQVLLYKRFYSKKLGVPEDKIKVQYFIVRRKINEEAEYVAKRIQEFVPAHGAKKVEQAYNDLTAFISDGFNADGSYQEKTYPKNPVNCKFCPYIDKPDLCNKKNG